MIVLKPMHLYVKYNLTVRDEIVIDDNDCNMPELCDAFKGAVKRVMDKAVKSKIGNSYKYWVDCDVDVEEV